MDVNSPEWSKSIFRDASKDCDFKDEWKCSKTGFACRDYMCPIVLQAENPQEVREIFERQKRT